MRFELLGPLQVVEDAGAVRQVAASRQRILLAALLLRAGQPVPVEQLAEVVWDGAPPAKAVATVRAYVMRLRQSLGPAAAARIVTREPGYLIQVEPAELDVLRFEQLCRQAAAAVHAQSWDEVADRAAQALALWRGVPLVDVASQLLRDAHVPHLAELRVQALEWGIDADLHRARPEQLVPQLQALVAEYPLRERFHAQLMLALARCGRQAEALAAYRHARQLLVAELGIEPGPQLRGLQERILAGTPEPAPEPPAAPPATPPAPVPRQLPVAVRHFAGRSGELKALTGLLDQTATAGMVVISAIEGGAGIGKTALAVHWAHAHADRFPDGQLYVNLRGFDPGGEPMRVEVAIRRFLDALVPPGARIPADLDAQIDLYRSQLAPRRMLIVLDNARDADQVRPLLPGAAGCLVLVTSRNQLTGLVAIEGARPLTLDLLSAAEAYELLCLRLGGERVSRAGPAAGQLVELCARLPLALNIAAARAVVHPDRPLAAVVAELRDARRRLDLLSTGDAAADVRAVFSWSYRTLDPAAAHAFRLLGLAPGPDLGLPAAAALLDLPAGRAEAVLATLVDATLLQSPRPGRYRLHDLLRAYAAEQAETGERPADRQAALRRLLAWYLRTALGACALVSPHRRLPAVDDGVPPLVLPGYAQAVDWLDEEYANLVAGLDAADRHGWPELVWKLAIALWDVCQLRGHYPDLIATHRRALGAARRLGDADAEGWLLSHLSVAYSDTGHPGPALDCLTQALAIDRRTGNRRSEAVNLVNLGYAYYTQQQFEQATRAFTEAVEAARETGHWRAEAAARNDLGEVHLELGRLDEALATTQAALAIYRAQGHPQGEAACLTCLGEIHRRRGDTAAAFRLSTQALALNREAGNRRQEANTLAALAELHHAAGRREQARTHWLEAAGIYRDTGDPRVAEIQARLDDAG